MIVNVPVIKLAQAPPPADHFRLTINPVQPNRYETHFHRTAHHRSKSPGSG
jgi:hypothetical protein